MANFEHWNNPSFAGKFDLEQQFGQDLFQSRLESLFQTAEKESIRMDTVRTNSMMDHSMAPQFQQQANYTPSIVSGDSFVWSNPLVRSSQLVTRPMWILPDTPETPFDWESTSTPSMAPTLGKDALPPTPVFSPYPFLDVQLPVNNSQIMTNCPPQRKMPHHLPSTSSFTHTNNDTNSSNLAARIQIYGRKYRRRTDKPQKKSVEAQCPLCLDIFTRKYDVKRHLRNIHPHAKELIKMF